MARLPRFQSEVVGTVAIVTAQISAMNQNSLKSRWVEHED